MRDEAAMAQEVVGYDAVSGRRPFDTEQVGPQPAGDRRGEVRAGGRNKEAVITFGSVHLEKFDVAEIDVQSGAKYAELRHHEIITELSANDDDSIKSIATIDAHGSVYGILNEIGAGTAGQIRQLALILLRAGQCECLNQECIVVIATVQAKHGQVVEGDEQILATLAVDRHWIGYAVGKPALGRFDGCKSIFGCYARQCRRAA